MMVKYHFHFDRRQSVLLLLWMDIKVALCSQHRVSWRYRIWYLRWWGRRGQRNFRYLPVTSWSRRRNRPLDTMKPKHHSVSFFEDCHHIGNHLVDDGYNPCKAPPRARLRSLRACDRIFCMQAGHHYNNVICTSTAEVMFGIGGGIV